MCPTQKVYPINPAGKQYLLTDDFSDLTLCYNSKDPTNKVSLSERIDDFLRIETLVRSRLNRQIVDGIRKVNYMGDPFNDTYRTIDGQIVGLSGILSYGNEIISELRKII